jgi:hypothetical protein
MTEFLKDLEKMKPGDPMPPINLGPFDNPLLWNMLDPYGADRPHQRRPLSVSRTLLEMHEIPIAFRDHCVHRYMPYRKCMQNLRPMTFGNALCLEFEEAWTECRSFEKYRACLLKTRWIEITKDYTKEDKSFWPDGMYVANAFKLWNQFFNNAASMRLSGWDEKDPNNPMMWKEPNRALMRTEFQPNNWERSLVTTHLGHKLIPPEVVEAEMGKEFPLPEDKRPPKTNWR